MRLTSFVLLLVSVLSCIPVLHAEDSEVSIKVGEWDRSFILHLPPGHQPDERYPLVMLFHGGGGNPASMVRLSGMNEKADAEGFIVAYPAGTGRFARALTFNGGNCCGYAQEQDMDDVAFVEAMLDLLIAEYGVDPKRVYATGLSNGGILSYRLANELADRIAAIAPVGGTMGTETCNPSRPVPVMHIHGTDDRFLSYEGGPGPNSVSKVDFYSVDHTIAAWVKANGCKPEPKVEELPDTSEDGCRVQRITYEAREKGGAGVVLIRIENGGHTWPGGPVSPAFLGTLCRDVNANDLMWDFFKRHSLE